MCTVKTCEVFKEYMILKEGQQSQLLCLENTNKLNFVCKLKQKEDTKIKSRGTMMYNVILQCVIGKVMVRG